MARSVDINLFKGFKNIEDGARPCPMRREAPIAEWGQSVGWCSVCKNKRNLFGRHNRGVKPGEERRGEWIIENTFGLQKYREKTLRNLLRNVSFLSFSLFFLFTCTRVFLVCMILVTLPDGLQVEDASLTSVIEIFYIASSEARSCFSSIL